MNSGACVRNLNLLHNARDGIAGNNRNESLSSVQAGLRCASVLRRQRIGRVGKGRRLLRPVSWRTDRLIPAAICDGSTRDDFLVGACQVERRVITPLKDSHKVLDGDLLSGHGGRSSLCGRWDLCGRHEFTRRSEIGGSG